MAFARKWTDTDRQHLDRLAPSLPTPINVTAHGILGMCSVRVNHQSPQHMRPVISLSHTTAERATYRTWQYYSPASVS